MILGVTATPARADGKQLGDVWQEIVYQRGVAEMIRAGYLADIRGVRVGLEQVKLDEVEQSGGDFDADALGRCSSRPPRPLHVLAAYREHATGRKAIVFVPTVALAHRMAAVFREAGIRAEALDGKTPWERAAGDPRATSHRRDPGRRQCGGARRGGRRPLGRRGDPGDSHPLTGEVHAVPRPRATDVPRQGGLPGDRCGRRVGAARPANLAAAVQPARRARARGDSHRGAGARALEKTEIDRRRALERQKADKRAAAAGRETPDGELRSRPVSMLAARRRTARRLRWLRHRECWLVSLGSTGTLALVPDGSRWRVLRLHGGKHDQLASGVDLGYAHGIAEDYVRAAGAQALAAPYARWRANPMNGAQANLLRRLGITAPEGATKGEASDLITVAQAAAAPRPARRARRLTPRRRRTPTHRFRSPASPAAGTGVTGGALTPHGAARHRTHQPGWSDTPVRKKR